jgi:predicted nucleic acid-binding protein
MVRRNELALCTPVLLELLYSARDPRHYAELAYELSGVPNLPLDPPATRRALETQALLAGRSQHRGPTPVDLLIAAVAELHELVLLHYDRHFEQIARVTGQPTQWLAKPGSLA